MVVYEPYHRLCGQNSFGYWRGEKVFRSRSEYRRHIRLMPTMSQIVDQTRSSPENSCLSLVVILTVMVSQPYKHFVWNPQ